MVYYFFYKKNKRTGWPQWASKVIGVWPNTVLLDYLLVRFFSSVCTSCSCKLLVVGSLMVVKSCNRRKFLKNIMMNKMCKKQTFVGHSQNLFSTVIQKILLAFCSGNQGNATWPTKRCHPCSTLFKEGKCQFADFLCYPSSFLICVL